MKTLGALLIGLFLASPAAAQPMGQTLGIFTITGVRPYLLVEGQQFTADDTFKAEFGDARGLFWGGGVEVNFSYGLFADVAVSRFERSGQRPSISSGQATSPLGTPLTATETPIEATVGYRLHLKRQPALTPYLGVGAGSYRYQETSDAADAAEDIDTRHTGILFLAGAEVRVHRLVSVSADAQYTRVKGILGTDGVSQQVNEDDLGGIAARVRILIGR